MNYENPKHGLPDGLGPIEDFLQFRKEQDSEVDEESVYEELGIDQDDLDLLDEDERRQVFEEAGLDPDDFEE